MTKNMYFIAAVAVGAILWRRGKAIEAAKNKIQEATPNDGSNWQGDLWGRLEGAHDLKAPVSRNLDNSVNADPGRVGQASVGLVPAWDGSLTK